jgi:hypothetical protein
MSIDPRRIEILDEPTLDAFRRMTPAELLATSFAMWRSVRAQSEAGVRWQHPDWTCEQVRREVSRRFLEDGSRTALVPARRNA